jgi:hypothetical protein
MTMTIELVCFEIPGRPLSWNQIYASPHWSKRKALSDEWKWRVKAALLKFRVPRVPRPGPVRISVCCYVNKPIDCDNIFIKPILDGLRDWQLLFDDMPEYVRKVSIEVIPKSIPERIVVSVVVIT